MYPTKPGSPSWSLRKIMKSNRGMFFRPDECRAGFQPAICAGEARRMGGRSRGCRRGASGGVNPSPRSLPGTGAAGAAGRVRAAIGGTLPAGPSFPRTWEPRRHVREVPACAAMTVRETEVRRDGSARSTVARPCGRTAPVAVIRRSAEKDHASEDSCPRSTRSSTPAATSSGAFRG